RAVLNKINADIDKEYNETVAEVDTTITEEGPVVVTTPKVTVTKYRRANDLGKKDAFAIYGSSKVHPEILKGSGQKVTITIAKADVGSIGGHGTAPGIMREAVAEVWAKAAEQGLILDFFITAVGDDISVTVTHAKGKDNKQIHELIWNGFVNAAVIAKDMGWYAAGQDLLADAFSGNVRGAGPSVAEMDIKERGSEVVIFAQADKTAPGAFNKGLWEILFGTSTTWRSLGKGQSQKIKFNKGDYDHAAWYCGYPDRFTYDNFMLEDGTEMGAVTAQRLGIIAGEYVGKDDPMFMIRSQSEFPAVGEIVSPFLKGEYVVPGWMRGSNKGPFFPVSLQDANIGIYDGPPLISMFSFNVTNGRLVGFYDLFAANPAIRHIQDKRAARAVTMLEQGFDEMSLRLAEVETAYQAGLNKLEASLVDRWEVYTDEKKSSSTLAAVAEQQKTDEQWRTAGEKVTGDKAKAVRDNVLAQTWGKLKEIAQNFSGDI
ncbi:fructose 1,6-bisphosphatase, partial [Candidatus Woesearchaeota archaeon]|nr:fructose 1,6-bisphosphatase [Candidatus Woesearchaeota archaeon]